MNIDINTPTPAPLLRLTDVDRARLGEALQALLAHGSILGLESGEGDLYAWSRQKRRHLQASQCLWNTRAASSRQCPSVRP